MTILSSVLELIVTILEGAEVRIGFYGRGGRDPPTGHFRGCRRPRGVAPRGGPEVDHDLRGQENPISPRTDESIGITFSEERSDDPYEQTLLGMLVTYTDPYEQAGLGMIGLYVK